MQALACPCTHWALEPTIGWRVWRVWRVWQRNKKGFEALLCFPFFSSVQFQFRPLCSFSLALSLALSQTDWWNWLLGMEICAILVGFVVLTCKAAASLLVVEVPPLSSFFYLYVSTALPSSTFFCSRHNNLTYCTTIRHVLFRAGFTYVPGANNLPPQSPPKSKVPNQQKQSLVLKRICQEGARSV